MVARTPQTPLTRMTRRKWLLLAGGTTVLGSGAYLVKRWGLIEAAVATPVTMRDHRVFETLNDGLTIVRGKSVTKNVRAALDAMGGLNRFILPTDRVLIKPNIAWDRRPEQGATTNPEVIAELVHACRDIGVKEIRVFDCPVHDPERSYQRSGIFAAARNAGSVVILPKQTEYAHVKIPGQNMLWPIRDVYLWADKIINVPIAKHHSSSTLTAGMKNWIGITDKRRELFHRNLSESIVELAAFVKPTLTLIDATRVLMRNGPQGGNLDDVKTLNTIIACTDPVAGDACACDLLGFSRDKVRYLKLAEERGLGTTNWKKRPPKELQLG
jgi:uncharacterized protein (DUF362 family)